ncbi:hypothetical protein BYT27DRAFT_6628698 [Phlegmacium glaucopus]|nr:hypothetical protein BYT27DRAFT_6628698 [Phlegmacium glaucopus]
MLISSHIRALNRRPTVRKNNRVNEMEPGAKQRLSGKSFSPSSTSTVVLRAGCFPLDSRGHALYLRGLSPQLNLESGKLSCV